MDRITKNGQMIAQRDEIFQFAKDQQSVLQGWKFSSVHLPPEFPDSLFYQGRMIWLRPGKRNARKLYNRGAYITESVREGGGGLAMKGRYRSEKGKKPFLIYMSKSGQIRWIDEFRQSNENTEIASKGIEVDGSNRVMYYRKKGTGKGYWLEGKSPEGKLLFQYSLENMPVKRLSPSDGQSIWLVWKTGLSNAGLEEYKSVQLNWAGEALKSGVFGLDGNICKAIATRGVIHIVGNFKKFMDWSGTIHKSAATRGYGTNVFCATLDTPELSRHRIIESPITIYANTVMFNPMENIMRMLGYKGEMEFVKQTGMAKGDIEWQEYINP